MAQQLQLFEQEKKIELGDEDKKYSLKINTPIYTPSGRPTNILECYDNTKYMRLLYRIDKADISDEEKKFLKFAATRHIVFNYQRIADYYASASKEMQELMEQSALVIIDFDRAIELGFVQLNEKMRALYEQELEES